MRTQLTVITASVLLFSCGNKDENPAIELSSRTYDPAPQVPSILRDVAAIDDDVEYTGPYVPGHRTSMDGRVAIRVQGGTEDIERLSTNLSFFLFVPEKLTEPIMTGPTGAEILSTAVPFDVEFPPALDRDVFRLGHHAICDPTEEFARTGEQPNPYPCGPNTLNDCYDLTVISSTSPGLDATLWGTPITIEVENPKTRDARIIRADLGTPVEGATIIASTEWTEPAITMDGRLMTGRMGRAPRAWTNPETGETLVRPYDLAYSVLPEGAAPCDITAWTEFHPMSHAPYDPQMVGTYGLAAYPFRDTEGELIPDGEDMGGTYPWVDREGANIFMTGVHGRITEQNEDKYPRSCVHPGCDSLIESIDFDRGFMVGGLWTHGKMVHLDGMINNIDWAVGVTPEAHWNVDLYEDEAGTPVPVRFGSGRFIGAFRNTGPYPDGYTHNANILDSLQNLPNFHAAAKPITPRDVVWIMSNGVATDEIAFDDLLDPNALIVSSMQASITQVYDDMGQSTSTPKVNNGEVREFMGIPGLISVYELQPELSEPIHLQNAATSLAWEVPSYGFVPADVARVEPVALGGIEGRGFWLSGDVQVRYPMPANKGVDDVPGYVGIFADMRTPKGEARELLTFPDGTGIVLDRDRVSLVREGRELHGTKIEAVDGWVHLGWRIAAGHTEVTLLVDGFALDRFETDEPVLSFGEGDLTIGRRAAPWTGFRGWVDNFVVLAHDVDVEVACNHAKGTLVDVGTSAPWKAVADGFPEWAHSDVAAAAGSSAKRFACVQDHSADYAAHLGNLPDGTTSVRAAIHFPEGPLAAGAPRPDSSSNAFCLSCHTDAGLGGLSVDALVADPATVAEHDLRRQPTQPPRRVFGNIPANWIAPGPGPGGPPAAMQAPPEGVLIDQWVLPAGL